jgi:predicted nucleotidyltransferase
MAEIKPEILKLSKEYIDLLNHKGIEVQQAYLFGSYVTGNFHDDSDIDLAILSDKFVGNFFQDKSKIRGLYRSIDLRLSTYPFTSDDIENNPFVKNEIINKVMYEDTKSFQQFLKLKFKKFFKSFSPNGTSVFYCTFFINYIHSRIARYII